MSKGLLTAAAIWEQVSNNNKATNFQHMKMLPLVSFYNKRRKIWDSHIRTNTKVPKNISLSNVQRYKTLVSSKYLNRMQYLFYFHLTGFVLETKERCCNLWRQSSEQTWKMTSHKAMSANMDFALNFSSGKSVG